MLLQSTQPKLNNTAAKVAFKPQPPKNESLEPGDEPIDNVDKGPSLGAKVLSKGLNIAIAAAAGYYFGEFFQGSMKATLIASAPGIVLGSAGIGLGVGLFAGMIGAKSGAKNNGMKALAWGAGTALVTGAVLTGGAAASQALTNALPWTPAINGAVMGGAGALLTSGTDWTKVAGYVKDKMAGGGSDDGGQGPTPTLKTNIPKPTNTAETKDKPAA